MDLCQDHWQEICRLFQTNRLFTACSSQTHPDSLCMMNHMLSIIDNSKRKADAVLSRIIQYADALVYEMYQTDDRGHDDTFIFSFGGAHHRVILRDLAFSDDASALKNWHRLCQKIMSESTIRVDFYRNPIVWGDFHCMDGINRLFGDLLEGGKLADCVTVYSLIGSNDVGWSSAVGEQYEAWRLYMNGYHGGQYVNGPVPYRRSDRLLDALGPWQEAIEIDDTHESDYAGLRITINGKIDDDLYQSLRAELSALNEHLQCEIYYHFERCEMDDNYCAYRSQYDWETIRGRNFLRFFPARPVKNTSNDPYENFDFKERALLSAPDLRSHFTPEELMELRDFAETDAENFVKYGRNLYPSDDVERVKFLFKLQQIYRILNRWTPSSKSELDSIFSFSLNEKLSWLLSSSKYCHFNAIDISSGLGDIPYFPAASLLIEEDTYAVVQCCRLKDSADTEYLCNFLQSVSSIANQARIRRAAELKRRRIPFSKPIHRPSNHWIANWDHIESLAWEKACAENPIEIDVDSVAFNSIRENSMAVLKIQRVNGHYTYGISCPDFREFES